MSAGRPTAWGVAGHAGAVDQLRRSMIAGQVRHATLITGPASVGKLTVATAYLKALLCLNPPAPGDFCDDCRSCGKIARGVHPDVHRFDLDGQAATAARRGTQNTTITIETAREVRSVAAMRPIEGRWRAVIIDDAETIAAPAQEALLKTLEEPPPSMLLLLLSDDREALLPTIRSRCEILDLRPVSRDAIEGLLRDHGADEERAGELARLAQGRPGWALRALTNPEFAEQHLVDIEEAIAWVESDPYQRLVTAVRQADRFAKGRAETLDRLGIVQSVWRDQLLIGSGLADRVTYLAARERLTRAGTNWNLADLKRALTAIQTCISDLEANVRPRLAMETMVLQWPNR